MKDNDKNCIKDSVLDEIKRIAEEGWKSECAADADGERDCDECDLSMNCRCAVFACKSILKVLKKGSK